MYTGFQNISSSFGFSHVTEESINKAIIQIQSRQIADVSIIVGKFQEISELKTSPKFINLLFKKRLYVVFEMLEWMLMPHRIMQRKSLTQDSNNQAYPNILKEFMKGNSPFYEEMYISMRRGVFPLISWFQFLRPQNYQETTVYTALGYLRQILIPFSKHNFACSYHIMRELDDFGIATEYNSILQIFTEADTQELLQYCHYKAVYQFISNTFLVSSEDCQDQQKAYEIMLGIFEYSQQPHLLTKYQQNEILPDDFQQLNKSYQLFENIKNTVSEMTMNIDFNETTGIRFNLLLQALLQSKLLVYLATELAHCPLCNGHDKNIGIPALQTASEDSSGNQDGQLENNRLSVNSQPIKQKSDTQTLMNEFGSLEIEQSQLIEVLLKIIKNYLLIYEKIPKITEIQPNSPYTLNSNNEQVIGKNTMKLEYSDMVNKFQSQIQILFDNMPIINHLVYNPKHESMVENYIPFSSGEDIKAISLMKYRYFEVLYYCLVVLQRKDLNEIEEDQQETSSFLTGHKRVEQNDMHMNSVEDHLVESCETMKPMKIPTKYPIFSMQISAMHIVEIIEKYLSQNRWNNLAHHILQKLCHILIVTQYEHVKINVQKDDNKKITDSFLAYLIENFMQKDYIYLTTLRFTSQGNLHSLYTISKFLTYTFNNNNKLVKLLNEFEPWHKFLMFDLKQYEKKAYAKTIQPNIELLKRKSYLYELVKVDEAETICKLIQNIDVDNKWPSLTKSSKKLAISNNVRYKNRSKTIESI